MHVRFGTGGNAAPCLGPGWSAPEADFTWTEGARSRLRLPVPGGDGALVLELVVSPMLHPPALAAQTLAVTVNGVALAPEAIFGGCAVAFDIPPSAWAGRAALDVTLDCPDAACPATLGASADPRVLGVAVHEALLLRMPERPAWEPCLLPPLAAAEALPEAVRDATGLTLPALAVQFESLGHDCEFGLAQRRMGAEPLGLLRFAAISPHKLLLGLDLAFEGVDAPDNLSVFAPDADGDAELMVRDRHYGMVLHTHRTARMMSPAALEQQLPAHFALLRRKFVEDLQEGRKICVFNHPAVRSVRQARPIANLLRSHGHCPLLFVVEDGAQPPGSVARVADDILQGWVGELGRERAGLTLDLRAWTSVCANAYRLCGPEL